MLNDLLELARQQGADMVGWAALDRGELALYSLLPPAEARRYRSALVVAKHHDTRVFKHPHRLPNESYDADYRRMNAELSELMLSLEAFLKTLKVACRAVNPSQTLDAGSQRGLISHRALAQRAGLGVRGRNNLLVTILHRSQVRLASLLTEFEVPRLPKIIWPYPCAECDQCRKACPAGALGQNPEDFRLDLCLAHLDSIAAQNLSPRICGICMAVCPGIEPL